MKETKGWGSAFTIKNEGTRYREEREREREREREKRNLWGLNEITEEDSCSIWFTGPRLRGGGGTGRVRGWGGDEGMVCE